MDAQALDTHKKILGIIYVITATLVIIIALSIRMILEVVFGLAAQDDPEFLRAKDLVMLITSIVPILLLVFSGIPTLIAGLGLLARASWASLLALIVGCFKLLSIPVGTAIGIYAIWIYSEEQRLKKSGAIK